MKKEIVKCLFEIRPEKEVISGYQAKTKGVVGLASKYNCTSTKTATVSNVIYALGMLLQGNVKVLYNEQSSQAYVEITYSPKKTEKAVVSENWIKSVDDLTDSQVVDFLSVYCFCKYDDELSLLLEGAYNDYINGSFVSLPSILKISDNTYFNFFKNLPDNFNGIVQSETVEEEIKQGIRNGLFGEVDMLKNFKCSDVSLGIKMKEKEKSSPKVQSVIPDDELDALELCKTGALRIKYDWGENEKYVPSLNVLEDFVPDKKHFVPMLRHFKKKLDKVLTRLDMGLQGLEAMGKDYINICISGTPGTGKTTVAMVLCAAFGLPMYVCKNSKNTEEDEYEGKTKVVKGEFSFVETNFLKGFTFGGVCLDEEYNLTNAGVKMDLGDAIETVFTIKRNGYEDVTRHPLCIYISTCNPSTEGTQDQNQAFDSRTRQTYVMNDPDDATFIKILRKWDEEYKENDCKKVLAIYKKVLAFLKTNQAEEIMDVITLRACQGTLESLYEGNSWAYSLEVGIVNKIYIKDAELAEKCMKTIINNMV